MFVIFRLSSFISEHVSTSDDSEISTASSSSNSVRVVIPGLSALSQDLSQTFNISDAAHSKALKVARDMELYEKRASNYRATLLLVKQKEAEAKKQNRIDEGLEEEDNNNEQVSEVVLDETLDPLDFWIKVSCRVSFFIALFHKFIIRRIRKTT